MAAPHRQHTPPGRPPRRPAETGQIRAVLGPTNTGKTHLAIERLCAHSSGAIGFPLRLLAREVYDRVCAIKGANRVALITGEERIEPKDARWLLCTAEAMPMGGDRPDLAFVALDEAQLAGDRERGHVFTDRLLHARGREETMLLGSATIAPLVRTLVPDAEIIGRPRFSTLSHVPPRKLSRLPPRSVVVAFSAEQVYAVAEMLRRFRGGAAVVMGALSPATRNAQVALFQSGEVDYLVATDAVGMGLNLDVDHVAFAGLSKFDGQRQRRLTPAEMAQIAGRAGRHQRDGSFGTLSGIGGAGTGGQDAAFSDEEIYAIEEHRFAPLARLFWRESSPRFDRLATLIADLEVPPERPELAAAPEAIDLAVLKRLGDEPGIAATLTSPARLRRFWDVCSLPDFRQQGAETHSRFVAQLWTELAHGALGSDHATRAIAQLDNVQGDIHALQGRIAAVRSWAYIAQRPDWLLARDEMIARARAVEARLSDALHARLTERFVNRRTAVLMRRTGADAALLPVALAGDEVTVDGEPIGRLTGFTFRVDPAARHGDHKLLRAAAERHLPALLAERAQALAQEISNGAAQGDAEDQPELTAGAILWRGAVLARLARGRGLLDPRLIPALPDAMPEAARTMLLAALAAWLARRLKPLAPLARIEAAARGGELTPGARAVLIALAEAGGVADRRTPGLGAIAADTRAVLRRLGVRIGALDLYQPALLRARSLALWQALRATNAPADHAAAIVPAMHPVLAAQGSAPRGYRAVGAQWVRIDIADALLMQAHGARRGGGFRLDPGAALAKGLTTAAFAQLLALAGFRAIAPRPLAPDAQGPPAPLLWRWQPPRPARAAPPPPAPPAGNAFAALARLVA